MFTDIVGYTALMGKDEDRAFETLRINRETHTKLIEKYYGTLIKEMGDGILVSFNSSSDAVRCAIEIQAESKKQEIPLKIGIHEGEMVFAGDDVLGDGVNIASRLEAITETGAITISEAIYRNIKNKPGIYTAFLEEKLLKNVDEPVKVYQVSDQEISVEIEKLEKPAGWVRKNWIYVLAAVGVLLIAVILIWKVIPINNKDSTSSVVTADKSIAVLPFRNDSPYQDNEYFCNGMMEEILNQLQKISALKVKARTSVEQYRDPEKDVKVIGNELSVAFIVEGSVRKIGDDLRITVQLIDANTGDHLWSDTYGGKYTDKIFEFQSSIAMKVAASLQAVITPQEEKRIDSKPTTNMLAHDLSLRGYEMMRKWESTRDSISLNLALNLLSQTLEIDPENRTALNGKGMAYRMGNNYDSANYYYEKLIELYPDHYSGYGGKGTLMWLILDQPDSAYKYMAKAVELGPNDPWANLGFGQILIYMKNDVINGLSYFRKAYELGGESTEAINFQIGWVSFMIGDYPKAEKYFKIAYNIHQACEYINGLMYIFFIQGRNDEALHLLDSICSISACGQNCDMARFEVYLNQKEFKQAREYYTKALDAGYRLYVEDSLNMVYLYMETGREKDAKAILENMIKRLENSLKDKAARRGQLSRKIMQLAIAYAIRDENEKALRYLSEFEEIRYIDNWYWYDYIQIYPPFENLWDDPEFKAIVKRAKDEKAALRAQLWEMEKRSEINF